jgi:hypothetical protein
MSRGRLLPTLKPWWTLGLRPIHPDRLPLPRHHRPWRDIADDGTVVGTTVPHLDGKPFAFVLKDGVFHTFMFPGAAGTFALSISHGGVIAGYYVLAISPVKIAGYGFAKAGDHYTSFAFPSDPATGPGSVFATRVIRMLPHGQAVGTDTVVSSLIPYGKRAFTYAGGQYYDIPIAGSVDTEVNGVNRFGSLAGYWVDGGGRHHGFLALCTPDQVPCTE